MKKPITRQEFAFALRAHRQRLKLTQGAIAAILGVAKRTLENWERLEGGEPLQITMEGAIARLRVIPGKQ